MLEILTTHEFAAWFTALEDGAAEDVATALETIEKLDARRALPGSSEWLLWYEHRDAPEFVVTDDWTTFHDAIKAIVGRLEAPAFGEKLRLLPHEEAGRVMVAIDALKMASSARRRGLSMIVAEALAKQHRTTDHPYETLRHVYQAAAAGAGLVLSDFAVNSSALRELVVRSPESRFRLLYGIDLRREVALVVLGERLDRSFYGDAVRRAAHIWQQFLENYTETRDPAPSR